MPVQAFRAARLLISSQEDLVLDGGVVVDSESSKIIAAGAWNSIKSHLLDEATVEDLGNVTLMPGILYPCFLSSSQAVTTSN